MVIFDPRCKCSMQTRSPPHYVDVDFADLCFLFLLLFVFISTTLLPSDTGGNVVFSDTRDSVVFAKRSFFQPSRRTKCQHVNSPNSSPPRWFCYFYHARCFDQVQDCAQRHWNVLDIFALSIHPLLWGYNAKVEPTAKALVVDFFLTKMTSLLSVFLFGFGIFFGVSCW